MWLQSPCIASFTTITILNTVSCHPFAYQSFGYSFIAQSSKTTVIFVFQNTNGFWNLGNITLVNSETKRQVFRNGDFRSGSLAPYYRQCQSRGRIASSNPDLDQYFYFDDTWDQFGYLMQDVSTTVGSSYDLNFYLRNPIGPSASFMLLLGI